MQENTDQNNSEYGHFSRSVKKWVKVTASDFSGLDHCFRVQYVHKCEGTYFVRKWG